MAAVRASAADAEKFIEAAEASERVSVAAINGARSVVISGSGDAVAKVLGVMEDASIMGRRLPVKHAFHSPSMGGIVKDYEAALSDVRLRSPSIRMVSTVRGHEDITSDVTLPSYWLEHLMRPVRFMEAVERSWDLGGRVFVEMGPDQTLSKLSQAIVTRHSKASTTAADRSVWYSGLDSPEKYEETRSSVESQELSPLLLLQKRDSYQRHPLRARKHHRLLQEARRETFSGLTVFTSRLHAGIIHDWLADHCLHGEIVLPGAALVELACAAASQAHWMSTKSSSVSGGSSEMVCVEAML